jgi:hypothetical protein
MRNVFHVMADILRRSNTYKVVKLTTYITCILLIKASRTLKFSCFYSNFQTAPGTPTLGCHDDRIILMDTAILIQIHRMVVNMSVYIVLKRICKILLIGYFIRFFSFIFERPSYIQSYVKCIFLTSLNL